MPHTVKWLALGRVSSSGNHAKLTLKPDTALWLARSCGTIQSMTGGGKNPLSDNGISDDGKGDDDDDDDKL